MKNTLMQKLNTLKPIFIVVILLAGFVAVSAIKWEDPSADHAGPPILEGGNAQQKTGQLTFSSLINMAHGPVVSYSPVYVGLASANIEAKTSFFGKLNLFNLVDPNTTTNLPLCTGTDGKVKTCSQGVLFEHVLSAYYTDNNVLTYPTGSNKVKGYIKYEIDSSVSCTTIAKSGTDWAGGTTLTGSNSSYAVTFDNWGTYALQISCTNSKTYTTNIDIKGRLKPTAYSQVQKFLFPSARTLEVKAQGGGAASGGIISTTNPTSCYGGGDGLPVFAHVTTSSSWSPNAVSGSNTGARYNSGANVVHAGGGYDPYSTYSMGRRFTGVECFSAGGDFVVNNLSSGTTKYGGRATSSTGGVPGSGLGHGTDGTGAYGNRGGGGGAYASGLYNISANNYIYLYNGGPIGSGGTASKPSSIIVEWK